jgi:hypothetical protein
MEAINEILGKFEECCKVMQMELDHLALKYENLNV